MGSVNSPHNFALVRYTASGDLDTSFGGGDGIVTTMIGPGSVGWGAANGEALSVALQPDGRILVAGYSPEPNDSFPVRGDLALVRYTASGDLDTTFGGGDGIVTTHLLPSSFSYDRGSSVTIQPDGRIVVAGFSFNWSKDTDYDFAVVRYNADGSLDQSFGAPTFVEGGPPVLLDPDALVYDSELQNNNGGAILTLARQGGANAHDVFGGTGTLSFANGIIFVDGVPVGNFTQSSGTLTITFANQFATEQRTNAVLRQIIYANTSDTLPVGVTIAYTFNDGNTGAQGAGGALSGTGSVFVYTGGVNYTPIVAVGDQSRHANEWVPLQSILSTSDANDDNIVQYQFYDSGSATDTGYFWTADVGRRAADTYITIAAADLGTTWVRGGQAVGSEIMWVRAFDGFGWGEWDAFTLTSQNIAPVVSVGDQTAHTNEWISLQIASQPATPTAMPSPSISSTMRDRRPAAATSGPPTSVNRPRTLTSPSPPLTSAPPGCAVRRRRAAS